ncbi:hypothetical protein SERLA73DRAFT_110154, partial [Serpula lacrymans var. lacrymans S7.3]
MLHTAVEETRIFFPKSPAFRQPQLGLLEWARHNDLGHFLRKLRLRPTTFDAIVTLIENHQIFHNSSNSPQYPTALQLGIFLVRVGHYGNAASCNEVAEWAGVSVGTVVLSTKRVALALMSLHDMAMCSPTDDEKRKAKAFVQSKVCESWRDGWLSVDGTTFPLFQKPSHFGEAWYDRSSNYSMNAQLVTLPHNLRIVDYALGHTGSVHDSYAFEATQIFRDHALFLDAGEWIWADSAYPIQDWCMAPFKRPTNGNLTQSERHYNYYL